MRRSLPIAGPAATLGATLLVLAGCAGQHDPRPSDLGFQWEVKRYYVDRATEAGGNCTRPAIRTITEVRTIEDSDAAVVKRVRYFWQDASVRRNSNKVNRLSGGSMSCEGFDDREFTFARLPDGSLQVIDMSGEQRRGTLRQAG
jgi:hypothetical protein